MLGWTIDRVAITISLPLTKLVQLRQLLSRWPADRRVPSESELRSLMGKLLHVCELVRPGNIFVRRMLNQLGLPPVPAGADEPWGSRGGKRARIRLGREFHDGLSFWRLLVDKAGGPGGAGSLEPPCWVFICNTRHARSSATCRGTPWGGYLETGRWWRIDLDSNTRSCLRNRVQQWDDLSTNVLELLAMVVTARAFTVHAKGVPRHVGERIIIRGDNMSAIHGVNRCRGGREPRAGALMPMLGCL